MSEPADHAATSLPDHELRSRAFLPLRTRSATRARVLGQGSQPVLSTPGLGLFPRLAELASIGLRPRRAFTIGALVAVPLGHALSTTVLSSHWARI